MEIRYKKALLKVAGPLVVRNLVGFETYKASKNEGRAFLSGSQFFRRAVSSNSYAYLVVSPGEDKECGFTILLGWGFGPCIRECNYLAQYRDLGGRIWPTNKYQCGFEQLEVLEGRTSAWGEVLPTVEEVELNSGPSGAEAFEQAVEQVLSEAIARVKDLLPEFVGAIARASDSPAE